MRVEKGVGSLNFEDGFEAEAGWGMPGLGTTLWRGVRRVTDRGVVNRKKSIEK